MPLQTPEFISEPSPQIQTLLNGKLVFCSFSGGADSLALLLLLKKWSGVFHFTLKAIHFEHGFRGEESLRDAGFCRSFCKKENIPIEVLSLDVPHHKLPGEGDENAARRMRHEMWSKIVISPEGTLIALAHHADDRTENIFLRLFRGSNSSGLTSMRAVQVINGLTYIRPLLDVTRKEIETFLHDQKLTWCNDSTNLSDQYGRNFIRLKLLPSIREKFPFAPSGIRQSLHTLEMDADYLEQTARQAYQTGTGSLVRKQLLGEHPAIRARILRFFLQDQLHLSTYIPNLSLIERFEDFVKKPRSGILQLTDQDEYFLVMDHDVFYVRRKENIKKTESVWNPEDEADSGKLHAEFLCNENISFPASNDHIYLDADLLSLPLKISVWEEGDHIIPFGHQKEVSLKKLFANARIHGKDRAGYPVIRDMHGLILWVAGLRTGNHALVSEKTKRILHLFLTQE